MSGAVATASAAALKPAHVPADRMAVDAAPQEAAEEDTYSRLKTLQRQLEFLEIQVRDGGVGLERVAAPGRQRIAAAATQPRRWRRGRGPCPRHSWPWIVAQQP